MPHPINIVTDAMARPKFVCGEMSPKPTVLTVVIAQ
jgi:hypothetical protein